MRTQSWGFNRRAIELTAEQREDFILAAVIGTSLIISTIIAVLIIASTVVSRPRYYPEPWPHSQLRWDDIKS